MLWRLLRVEDISIKDYLAAVGNFHRAFRHIDLCSSSCHPLLRSDHIATHIKRERVGRIINCSIKGTQKTHLKQKPFNDSVPGRETSFLPLFIRECFQIKAIYHSVMHIITAGSHRPVPIPQLVSVCDMNPRANT